MAYIHHGFFIGLMNLRKEEEKMKIVFIGMMAATFVLGMGFLSFMFVFGKILLAEAQN